MRNNKGQALIEFVLLLPILIFLIFSFIDFGRILLETNRLESITPIVIDKYNEKLEYKEISEYLESIGYKNIDVSIESKDNNSVITVSKSIDIITPGLSNIIGDPYVVKVERTINHE